jgi:hypothetical protein
LSDINIPLSYPVHVAQPKEQPAWSVGYSEAPLNSASQVVWTTPHTIPIGQPNLNGDVYIYPGTGTSDGTFFGNKQTYPGPAPTLTAVLGADIIRFKVLASSYRITSMGESKTIQEILSAIPGVSFIEASGLASYPEIAFATHIWDAIMEYTKVGGFADLGIIEFLTLTLPKREGKTAT